MFSMYQKRKPPPPMTNGRMATILIIVAGCFIVLVPSIFYPIARNTIKAMFGSNYDTFDYNSEGFLPKKVEMTMKNSPKRDSNPKTFKLPGRPQFYAGANMEKMYQKIIPESAPPISEFSVPTVIITFVVVYILIKILFYSNEEVQQQHQSQQNIENQSKDEKKNCECRVQTVTPKVRESRRRDPIDSRPTYRAFDCYGTEEVGETFSNLLQNMESFRDNLSKAKVCQCKLDRLDAAHKEFLQSETSQEQQTNDETQAQEEEEEREEESKEEKKLVRIVLDSIVEEDNDDNKEITNKPQDGDHEIEEQYEETTDEIEQEALENFQENETQDELIEEKLHEEVKQSNIRNILKELLRPSKEIYQLAASNVTIKADKPFLRKRKNRFGKLFSSSKSSKENKENS